MEYVGFNFKNKGVRKLLEPEVIVVSLDLDNVYFNCSMEQGVKNVSLFFDKLISEMNISKDCLIKLEILSEDLLSYNDYLFLGSTLLDAISVFGIKNDKGYMGPKEWITQQMASTNHSILNMMNHDFELGTIQMIIYHKEKDIEIEWVNNKY